MSVPTVAVVGRPNVGKSTLVNRIIGRREAIVESHPGVTRDRKVVDAEWVGRRFQVVDTGGWIRTDEPLARQVSRQAERAIDEADVVVMVVDGTVGPTEEDASVAAILRRSSKPVLLAVNKVDDANRESDAWDFVRLGLGDPLPVSALHGRGSGELLDVLVDALPEAPDEPEADEPDGDGIDATEGVTHQDQRLAERVDAAGCATVVVLNKWDLLDADEREDVLAQISDRLGFLAYAPVLKTSALTGRNVGRLLPALFQAREEYHRRVPTRKLNEVLAAAQVAQPPPVERGHRPRILYATQGATDPPTFTLFTTRALPPGYLRYLERKIREAFSIGPTPIKLRVRRRGS